MKRSNSTKLFSLMATLVIALLFCLSMAACTPSTPSDPTKPNPDTPATAVDKNENITTVVGTYSHFLGFDIISKALPASYVRGTGDNDMYQNTRLTLFQSEGKNYYHLERNLNIPERGAYFWQYYVGEFEWTSGREVTLKTPTSYSYFYGYADGYTDDSGHFNKFAVNIKVDLSDEAIAAGTTIVRDNGNYTFVGESKYLGQQGMTNSGLYGFNMENGVADYHNKGSYNPIDIKVDLNTNTFEYVTEE